MTFIQKIMISGIRSFSPKEPNTLEFYSPLTLIVGSNGTGKTTIIESLRYATTGHLPPNSRGGAFIYDPKVAQETEVKAQVKILFMNTSNKPMVCTRSLQLTQKKGKVEQKTLESVLWMEGDKGESLSVSSRCADVDEEMPHHLGVSTNVLDSIIFCHQEESTWPLCEPIVFKKKLDDIFASTKYSKALDSLKSAKKECSSDIKLRTQELEFLYKMKEKKGFLETKVRQQSLMMEKNEVKLEAYDIETKNCNAVIVEVDGEINKVEDSEKRAFILNDEYEKLRSLIDNFEGQKLSLSEARCILSSTSLAKVEDEYERAKNEVGAIEEKFEGLSLERSKYLSYKKELDGLFSEISVKSLRLSEAGERRKELLGFLESELKVRDNFKETASLVFSKVDRDIDDRRKRIHLLQTKLFRLMEDSENRDQVLNEKMDIVSRYRDLEDDLDIDVSLSYEGEIEKLRLDDRADQELEILEKKLEEYQKRLNKAFAVAEENFGLDQLRSRRKEIEDILSGKNVSELKPKLEEQRLNLKSKKDRFKEVEQEISLRAAIKIQRERELANIRRKIQERLDALDSLEKEVPNLVKEVNVQLTPDVSEYPRERLEEIVRNNNDFFLLEGITESKLGFLDFELVYNKESLAAQAKEIKDALGGRSSGGLEVYRELLSKGSASLECPICNKTFSNLEEDRFRRRLEAIIEKAPKPTKDLLEKREKIYKAMEIVEDLNNRIRSRNRLREGIIDLILSYEPEGLQGEPVDEEILENLELDILDDIERIGKTEFYIDLANEMSSIREKLRNEEVGESVQELKSMVDGIKKIYEENKMEVKKRNEMISSLCKKQEMINAVRDIRVKINFREEAKEAIRLIGENKLKVEISKIEEEVRKGTEKVERIQDAFSRKRVGLDMKIEGFYKAGREIEILKAEIESLNLKVKLFLSIECPEEAKDEDRFNSLRNDLLARKNRMLELGQEIRSMDEMRKLAQNSMEYHKSVERAAEVKSELETIDLGYLNTLRKKKQLLEEKKTKLISQKSLLLGECKQIALGIKSSKSELQRDHISTVEDYNRCFVEVKTLELSSADLDKCIQVLDRAIMDFHCSKLEEVNSTLKDLWINTYKGNDIDWIEIKSESLGQKTYSYRVMMVKNGVELDMRGRSSAGQRMIASILIRLALADSFAANCNILTLDEPTTNLDRDNIESLAFTLSKIIHKHKGNENFQLIVITHDEDFVQLLSRDGAEYFYRLTRDENGDSAIVRHSVYST